MSLKVDAEVKISTDPCLLVWDDRLYVGGEDGSIQTFDASLKPGTSWKAHSVQLFALTAGEGRVYSASNDGGVRVWSPEGNKLAELKGPGGDVGTLVLDGERLYAGNEVGAVAVYEKDDLVGTFNVLEEVKDIVVVRPYLLTVRDLDVTVTEMKEGSKFVTWHTFEGRAPIRTVGNKLLVVSRDGKSIQVHENSIETKYKKLHVEKVSEMIITCLAVDVAGSVWSGSWDGRVRRWTLVDATLVPAGDVDIGACINSLTASAEPGAVYAAAAGGNIVRVKVV